MITVAFACVAVLLEALGWGLFWSAVSASALTAAALAVCSMGIAQVAMMQGMWFSPDEPGLGHMAATGSGPGGGGSLGRRPHLERAGSAGKGTVLAPPEENRAASVGLASYALRSEGSRDRTPAMRPEAASPRPAAMAAAWSLAWLTAARSLPLLVADRGPPPGLDPVVVPPR